jgi:valyl-tRNA synthetase
MADAGRRALDPEAGPEIEWLIRVVSGIRAARTELNVPPGAKLPLLVRDAGEATAARLQRNSAALQRLARIERSVAARPAAERRRSWSMKPPTSCRSKASSTSPRKRRAWKKALQAAEKERR